MDSLRPRNAWIDERLHWREWGSAPGTQVLLVHGITGNARNWENLASALARTRRIVAPDLRGHGESACMEGESYEHLDYLADLLVVIERAGPPVSTVGHSIGGYVCLILAALRFELITSLVLVDVEAFPPRAQPERLRRLGAEPPPVFADLEAVVRELRQRHPPASEELLHAKAEHDTRQAPNGGRVDRFDPGALRRVTAPDARPYLPRVPCPVLLVRGAQSAVMRADAAKSMAPAIPQACLVEIPGAGHWPQIENPRAFEAAVLPFLDGHPSRNATGRGC